MNRTEFIKKHGATCNNWHWSWSFIDTDKRVVIFGIWPDRREKKGKKVLMFSESWNNPPHTPGYKQSREHIRLIQESHYTLKTFPFKFNEETRKIQSFTEKLTLKTLSPPQGGDSWWVDL